MLQIQDVSVIILGLQRKIVYSSNSIAIAIVIRTKPCHFSLEMKQIKEVDGLLVLGIKISHC
jgi:hypothetical protein